MTDNLVLRHEQLAEIFKCINGIGELLQRLPSRPEDAAVMYAIASNLAAIQTKLTGMPRANPN